MTAIAASPAPIDVLVAALLLLAFAVWSWRLHRGRPRDAVTCAAHHRTRTALARCHHATRRQDATP